MLIKTEDRFYNEFGDTRYEIEYLTGHNCAKEKLMADLSSKYGVQTLSVHAGEAPDPNSRASAPNIVMSSTFVVDEPTGFSAHDLDAESPYLYSRWANPTVDQLQQKLAVLEGGESSLCFASGMAAAAAIFLSELSSGDHLVISDVSYAGVAELARDTLPRMGVSVTTVDTSDLDAVRASMRTETKLIWIETPANPLLRLTDIQGISAIAKAAGAKVAVDSTFATPIATRPLELGADYVMHSLTKYLGGHGDALGGTVIANQDNITNLRMEAIVHFGGVLSPFNAWLIMRGMATLPLRMNGHETNAKMVAEYLEQHPNVLRVNYPGLASHHQHDLAVRQMKNFSGMLSFQVEDPKATAQRMMDDLEVIHYAVSLGHHRSLVFWLGTKDLMKSSFRLEGDALERYRDMAGDGVFRFSTGLENGEDLIADLDQVL